MSKTKNNYYVYIWHYDGSPVYVGMGKGDRWKHGNSGKSHVYGLNKLHFLGGERSLSCKIIKEGLNKESALVLESELIAKFKSAFNKENNSNIRDASRKNISRVNREQKYKVEKHYIHCYQLVDDLVGILSNSKIAGRLNSFGLKTPRGANWNKQSVRHMINKVRQMGL